ncbi:MAG: SRPBCC domain-containing protein [Paracoccaceae bacterium]|nr:SRPBCC domain-containing protein [Paracoccaceae bacterium]
MTAPLSLSLDGDRALRIARQFAARPEAVFRAHTDPALIRQWMVGPEGWTMPVCESDPRPGGGIRFEWSDGKGNGFHLTGEYLELDPSRRLVHVERMFLPDPTPDNRVETRFDPAPEGGTRLTVTMTLPDADTRAAMLESGMEHGMEASYARLEALLDAPGARR